MEVAASKISLRPNALQYNSRPSAITSPISLTPPINAIRSGNQQSFLIPLPVSPTKSPPKPLRPKPNFTISSPTKDHTHNMLLNHAKQMQTSVASNTMTPSVASVKSPTLMRNHKLAVRKTYTMTNHMSTMMVKMCELWKQGKMCDAILRCGGFVVKTHKLLLIAASPYLCSVAMSTEIKTILDVKLPTDIGIDTVRDLVSFLYTGAITISSSHISQLLRLCRILQINSVEVFCLDFQQKFWAECKNPKMPTSPVTVVSPKVTIAPVLQTPVTSQPPVKIPSTSEKLATPTTSNTGTADIEMDDVMVVERESPGSQETPIMVENGPDERLSKPKDKAIGNNAIFDRDKDANASTVNNVDGTKLRVLLINNSDHSPRQPSDNTSNSHPVADNVINRAMREQSPSNSNSLSTNLPSTGRSPIGKGLSVWRTLATGQDIADRQAKSDRIKSLIERYVKGADSDVINTITNARNQKSASCSPVKPAVVDNLCAIKFTETSQKQDPVPSQVDSGAKSVSDKDDITDSLMNGCSIDAIASMEGRGACGLNSSEETDLVNKDTNNSIPHENSSTNTESNCDDLNVTPADEDMDTNDHSDDDDNGDALCEINDDYAAHSSDDDVDGEKSASKAQGPEKDQLNSKTTEGEMNTEHDNAEKQEYVITDAIGTGTTPKHQPTDNDTNPESKFPWSLLDAKNTHKFSLDNVKVERSVMDIFSDLESPAQKSASPKRAKIEAKSPTRSPTRYVCKPIQFNDTGLKIKFSKVAETEAPRGAGDESHRISNTLFIDKIKSELSLAKLKSAFKSKMNRSSPVHDANTTTDAKTGNIAEFTEHKTDIIKDSMEAKTDPITEASMDGMSTDGIGLVIGNVRHISDVELCSFTGKVESDSHPSTEICRSVVTEVEKTNHATVNVLPAQQTIDKHTGTSNIFQSTTCELTTKVEPSDSDDEDAEDSGKATPSSEYSDLSSRITPTSEVSDLSDCKLVQNDGAGLISKVKPEEPPRPKPPIPTGFAKNHVIRMIQKRAMAAKLTPSQCVYRCSLCDLVFIAPVSCIIHIQDSHNLDLRQIADMVISELKEEMEKPKPEMIDKKPHPKKKKKSKSNISPNTQYTYSSIDPNVCVKPKLPYNTPLQKCLECGALVRNAKTHFKNVHDLTFGHHCDYCKKPFKQLSALRLHMRIHTNVKPYRCPICEFTSCTKCGLVGHLKIHGLSIYEVELPTSEEIDLMEKTAIFPPLPDGTVPKHRARKQRHRQPSTEYEGTARTKKSRFDGPEVYIDLSMEDEEEGDFSTYQPPSWTSGGVSESTGPVAHTEENDNMSEDDDDDDDILIIEDVKEPFVIEYQ